MTEMKWHGVLAPEGVLSGDGRKFAEESLTWRDLPLPLSWQKATATGHDGSVVVGRIDTIERDGVLLRATGALNDTPEAQEVTELVANKSVRGVSVDVDKMVAAWEDPEGNLLDATKVLDEPDATMLVTSGRVAGATICPIPAFAEAFIALDSEFAAADMPPAEAPPAEKPAESKDTKESLDAEAQKLLDSDMTGDDLIAAADALLARYQEIEETPPDALIEAAGLTTDIVAEHLESEEFADETISDKPWGDFGAADYDEEQWFKATIMHLNGDSRVKGDNKLPVREPDGTLNRNGIHAAASALAGGRGGVNAPAEAKTAAAKTIVGLYGKLQEDPPDSIAKLAGSSSLAEYGERTRMPDVLADYWTHGEGAAKIAWGTPGDFNRCREQLAQYLRPDMLAGACSNLHERALGVRPGQEAADVSTFETVSNEDWEGGAQHFTPEQWKRSTLIHLQPGPGQSPETKGLHKLPVRNPGGTLVRRAILSAASILAGARGGVHAPVDLRVEAAQEVVRLYREELGEDPPKSVIRLSGVRDTGESEAAKLYPALFADALVAAAPPQFFENPLLPALTPLTIEGDHVYGHLAKWGTCHIGRGGTCVSPPPSATEYAYFRTGAVETGDGLIPVGQITMSTGHAEESLAYRPTLDHYDNTGTAVADIVVGDDEFGIWYSGAIRPGATQEQRETLLASSLSGDWRRIGGDLELVAALAVNVPGFPIPRTTVAEQGGYQTALVASGVVVGEEQPKMLDDSDAIGRAVARHLTMAANRRRRANRYAANLGRDRRSRALAAAAGMKGE